MQRNFNTIIFFLLLAACSDGCKKLVDIPPPFNSITTSQTFSTEEKATAAVTGIYYDMSFSKNDIGFSSGSTTIQAGLYADELSDYGNPSNVFFQNNLPPDNSIVYNAFWNNAYFDIYTANAAIEGINSSALPDAVKKQLTGECKFIRAFCNFYLVNLFGSVPLITTSSWSANALVARDSTDKIYEQIITDLKDAQSLLGDDYAFAGGDRTRANKWVVTALLARMYLYTGDWQQAQEQAATVINNSSLYNLGSLNDIFSRNNGEAIFQLQCVTRDNFGFATQEGNLLVPPPYSWAVPSYTITPQLLTAFEQDDQRKVSWTNYAVVDSDTVYYPYKFKIRTSSAGDINEYNTPLRLAEQYLIRAEAYAQQNKLPEALADLNMIRQRAGLPDLSSSLDQDQVMAAIAQENRIEFFAEWGHRWFDLKRTGQADAVLGSIKGANWQATDKLWPIPQIEITNDPNLKQNPGY
jgi:hypothetical protein